jgi:hypothetical protein
MFARGVRYRGAEGVPPPISLSIANRVVRNCVCDRSAWTNGQRAEVVAMSQ